MYDFKSQILTNLEFQLSIKRFDIIEATTIFTNSIVILYYWETN